MGDLRKVCKYRAKQYCMAGANFSEPCTAGNCPVINHRAANILKQKPFSRTPHLKMKDDGNETD